MCKRPKRSAYLIAVRESCETARVYAIVAVSPEAALAQMSDLATEGMQLEIVGGLSRALVRRFGLEPGEMRPV